jgi:kynurenine formamidase
MADLDALVRGLSEGFRIVDLSQEVRPGILKVNGVYRWSEEPRRFELRQFVAPGPHLMHFIEAESHIGTHVEVPSHLRDEWKSCAEMPLDAFWGEGIVFRFDDLPPDGSGRPTITAEHVKRAKAGDIVLVKGAAAGRPVPRIGPDARDLLASLPIRMLGEENVGVGHDVHIEFFKRDIPIIERLVNLDALTKERFLFFGLPLRVHGLDSSWIRAVAFEAK